MMLKVMMALALFVTLLENVPAAFHTPNAPLHPKNAESATRTISSDRPLPNNTPRNELPSRILLNEEGTDVPIGAQVGKEDNPNLRGSISGRPPRILTLQETYENARTSFTNCFLFDGVDQGILSIVFLLLVLCLCCRLFSCIEDCLCGGRGGGRRYYGGRM